MLQSMTIRLMHMHKLDTLYQCYGVKCQPGVIWGHTSQKVIFTKNTLTPLCYIAYSCNPYICISSRPSISLMGSKVNLGSFRVIRVMFWFSPKVHDLFYVTKYIHVIHTLASHLQDQKAKCRGSVRGRCLISQSQQGTPSVTATCLVLYFFQQTCEIIDLYCHLDLNN